LPERNAPHVVAETIRGTDAANIMVARKINTNALMGRNLLTGYEVPDDSPVYEDITVCMR